MNLETIVKKYPYRKNLQEEDLAKGYPNLLKSLTLTILTKSFKLYLIMSYLQQTNHRESNTTSTY